MFECSCKVGGSEKSDMSTGKWGDVAGPEVGVLMFAQGSSGDGCVNGETRGARLG